MTGRANGEKRRGLRGGDAGREAQIVRVRKSGRGMTNYSLSTYHMHPFRKEEHCLLTLLSKYARLVRSCVPEKMMGGV